MAKRIAVNNLTASTIDIMNVIRQNAPYEYQSSVPVVTKATDIPAVGEIIYGTPAFANTFINALVNRIALVRANSLTFNNPYSRLKKGYLEFGETIEQIFVGIATALEFDPEKAEAREHKRYLPDVKSAFHVMNYRVLYPVTIQDEDLKQAFLSENGVQELIAKIVDAIYTAAEYDEFLLFKYMLIKAAAHGKMYGKSISLTSGTTPAAVAFRGASNLITFPKREYNESGVLQNTPKSRQVIFMDANFNADYDVNVLASAFNMDKAEFMGSLFLIDDWTTFDNDRFEIIRSNSDGIEEITAAELTAMSNVKAILMDEDWFQVYDNNNKFTEKYMASGLYWNYFYHVWKTVSHSPFHNAICFSTATLTEAASFTFKVDGLSTTPTGTMIITLRQTETTGLPTSNVEFLETNALVTAGVAVQPYGAYIIPNPSATGLASGLPVTAVCNGTTYTATIDLTKVAVGTTVTLAKPSSGSEEGTTQTATAKSVK